MNEATTNEDTDESAIHDAVRWLIALAAAFAIFWMLLFARGEPGIDGRAPDPEDASAFVLEQPSEMT